MEEEVVVIVIVVVVMVMVIVVVVMVVVMVMVMVVRELVVSMEELVAMWRWWCNGGLTNGLGDSNSFSAAQ